MTCHLYLLLLNSSDYASHFYSKYKQIIAPAPLSLKFSTYLIEVQDKSLAKNEPEQIKHLNSMEIKALEVLFHLTVYLK